MLQCVNRWCLALCPYPKRDGGSTNGHSVLDRRCAADRGSRPRNSRSLAILNAQGVRPGARPPDGRHCSVILLICRTIRALLSGKRCSTAGRDGAVISDRRNSALSLAPLAVARPAHAWRHQTGARATAASGVPGSHYWKRTCRRSAAFASNRSASRLRLSITSCVDAVSAMLRYLAARARSSSADCSEIGRHMALPGVTT